MKGILAALAVASLLPTAAMAADLNYTYAEAAYSNADTDAVHGGLGFSGGQGYALDGSYALDAHWFLEGDYRYNSFRQYFASTTSASIATRSGDLTPQSLTLGGGYHTALGDGVDFLTHLDYGFARTELSLDHPDSSTTESDDGYVLGVGLRIQTDLLEWQLGVDHDDLGLGRQTTSACAKCSVITHIRQGGTENLFSVAARHDFGPVIAGVEYRRSGYQGWRELLASLRIDF